MDDEAENESEKSNSNDIWKYFEVVNEQECKALCKHCNEIFSYKKSIIILRNHLERKHNTVLSLKSDDEEEDHLDAIFLEEEKTDEIILSDKRKQLRNGSWEYFQVTDEEQRKAICRLCHEEFSYRTTSTNLTRHLKSRHYIEFKNSDDDDEVSDVQELDTRPARSKGRVSVSWNYFTITDPERRVAKCKLCKRECSYLTSVTNLMKHVERKHGVMKFEEDDADEIQEYESDEKLVELSGDMSSSEQKTKSCSSSVWLYFKCVDKKSGISVCLVCKKRLSHKTSITNLKRHLHRKHPHLSLDEENNGKKMLISSDGQLYEVEDQSKVDEEHIEDEDGQPAEPMQIYLDEVDGNVIEKKTIQRQKLENKRKSLQNVKRIVIRDSDNDSSDEEITVQKRYARKKKDSLDQFGLYLVSLLRQMPRQLSNRLQADFVKQIMTCQEPKTIVTNNGNGYAITITDAGATDVATVTSASNDERYVMQTSIEQKSDDS